MKLELVKKVRTSGMMCLCLTLYWMTNVSVGTVSAQTVGNDTLRDFWNSTEFKQRFLATYGVASEIEPKFGDPEEQTFYAEIRGLIFDNPAQAINLLQQKITPQSSATLDFTLGALQFSEGNSTGAVQNYQKAIDKFPDFRRAHRNLGVVLARNGEYEAASKSLTRTIQLGDSDSLVYGLLGVCYSAQGRHFPAEAALRNAIILEPDSLDWQVELVKSYLAQQKYNEAERLLETLVAGNPESEKLLSYQANVLIELERYEEAQVNLEILKEKGSATTAQLFLLGDLYLNENYTELANNSYMLALDKDQNPSPSRILRAVRGFVERGVYNTASELLNKVKTTYGSTLEGQEQIELLKQETRLAIATDSMDQVPSLLDRILALDPLDGEALLMAGDHLNAMGDVERAMYRYESASKVDGFQADGLVKQAQLLVQRSEYRKAITLLKKAQEITPRSNIQRYLENIERLATASSS